MIKNGKGGSNTHTGLIFEDKVDLESLLLQIQGYDIKSTPGYSGKGIFFNDELVARCFKKYDFYKYLAEHKINWAEIISKRLLPDISHNKRNLIYN
jgi:hypothetical protein